MRRLSSAVSYGWAWPNSVARPGVVKRPHSTRLPMLTGIGVGQRENATPAYDWISFTFTTAFPSYDLRWVDQLTAGGRRGPVRVEGNTILRIRFAGAEAHDESGSTVRNAPPTHIGYRAITSCVQTGDSAGVVTYGVGNDQSIADTHPQPQIRAVEITAADGLGGYLYIVAIDIQTRATVGRQR